MQAVPKNANNANDLNNTKETYPAWVPVRTKTILSENQLHYTLKVSVKADFYDLILISIRFVLYDYHSGV